MCPILQLREETREGPVVGGGRSVLFRGAAGMRSETMTEGGGGDRSQMTDWRWSDGFAKGLEVEGWRQLPWMVPGFLL